MELFKCGKEYPKKKNYLPPNVSNSNYNELSNEINNKFMADQRRLNDVNRIKNTICDLYLKNDSKGEKYFDLKGIKLSYKK